MLGNLDYDDRIGAGVGGGWLAVAEISHRVANEYAMAIASISLAASRSSSLEAKAALAGAAGRLRDFAAAHRALQTPASSGPADLSDYLKRLCAALVRASLAERGVSLTFVEQRVELDAERCWRLGLIVSELVTNAVRHGFRGSGGAIVVQLDRAGDILRCSVADDGRPNPDARPGHGSRIVEALARELGGGIERRCRADGTTVVLSLPLSPFGPGDRDPLSLP